MVSYGLENRVAFVTGAGNRRDDGIGFCSRRDEGGFCLYEEQ